MHQLKITPRTSPNRGSIRRKRVIGTIPAVIYGGKTTPQAIELDVNEFVKIKNKIQPNHLSTAQFELLDGEKTQKAIVKDIQYHPVSYAILHLDFELLHDHLPISLRVPLDFLGVEECAGIKQGGFLRQVIRSVKVKCLPADIPERFTLDVRELGIKQTRKLKEIVFPQKVTPLAPLQEVAVVISKR